MARSFTPTSLRAGQRRRVVHALHGNGSILLALALLLLVNILSGSLYLRVDLRQEAPDALSPKTVRLLRELEVPVTATLLLQTSHEAYADILTLLREYVQASRGRLRIERIDPDRNLARLEDLAERYAIPDLNVILFEATGRTRIVSADELVDLDFSPMLRGGLPRPSAFLAEQAFSSAILSITRGDPPVVYALTGHGEGDFFDPHAFSGFSRALAALQRDDINLIPLDLAEAGGVPGDADAVIVAGPDQILPPPERRLLGDYLRRSGRLFLMLDHGRDEGVLNLLREWGVEVIPSMVVDPGHTLSGLDLFVRRFTDHPVVADLQGMTVVLSMPLAVQPANADANAEPLTDEPRVVPLAATTTNGWADLRPEVRPFAFDPGIDRPGPVTVAVAVEEGTAPSLGVDIRPARLVVVGDADFLSNGGLSGANEDLFLNGVNWLLDRDLLLSVAPRPIHQTEVLLDNRDLRRLFLLFVLGIPGALAAAGLVVLGVRRR